MNINKVIFKSIGMGYPGEPLKTNLMDIQDWLISTYKLIPCTHWSFKDKAWKAYVYPYDYDPVEAVKTIRTQKNMSAKEATEQMNIYAKQHFVVKNNDNNELFANASEGLYWAIVKTIENVKTIS